MSAKTVFSIYIKVGDSDEGDEGIEIRRIENWETGTFKH